MHLAIVGPYPPNFTGISQYGYHVSQSLAQSGQFSRITVLADAPNTSQTVSVHAPIVVERVWQAGSWAAGWKIVQRLQDLQPDLVWFNLDVSAFGRSAFANLSGFLSPLGAHRLGFPSVVTLHELVELAAVLVPTTAKDADLDAITEHLGRHADIESATWTVSTTS